MLPPLSRELAWRLDHMHTRFDVERLGGMARLEGNPWRIEIGRFGRATAFVSRALASDYYNKVLGVGTAELALLDEMADFFTERGAPTCRVEILPGEIDERLADALVAFGLRHVAFYAGYYGLPSPGDPPAAPGVEVRGVESEQDLDAFLEVFHVGWAMEPATLGAFKETMRFWRNIPAWTLYLASIDGTPCAIGIMHAEDDIGYLAVAATLKEFRGKGCERALLHRSLEDARQLGCKLVAGQCEVGSPTGRNFLRAGLRLAYHKAIWMLPERVALEEDEEDPLF